jgi:hypothetical protein
MKAHSYLVAFMTAICALLSIDQPASASAADVTGTIKSNDVALSVTVKGSTAHFSGKVISATKMSGTVTGTSDKSRKWSAEKKK